MFTFFALIIHCDQVYQMLVYILQEEKNIFYMNVCFLYFYIFYTTSKEKTLNLFIELLLFRVLTLVSYNHMKNVLKKQLHIKMLDSQWRYHNRSYTCVQ